MKRRTYEPVVEKVCSKELISKNQGNMLSSSRRSILLGNAIIQHTILCGGARQFQVFVVFPQIFLERGHADSVQKLGIGVLNIRHHLGESMPADYVLGCRIPATGRGTHAIHFELENASILSENLFVNVVLPGAEALFVFPGTGEEHAR